MIFRHAHCESDQSTHLLLHGSIIRAGSDQMRRKSPPGRRPDVQGGYVAVPDGLLPPGVLVDPLYGRSTSVRRLGYAFIYPSPHAGCSMISSGFHPVRIKLL